MAPGESSDEEGSPADDVTRLPSAERRSAITFSVDRILGPGFGRSGVPEEGEERRRTADEPPIWIYCSRFSARPTAGPRRRSSAPAPSTGEDRRCRTAFTSPQVARLRAEFQRSEYLSEGARRDLAQELGLTESQVKIWFQNARAKRRRNSGRQSPLAQKLAEAGLYNHSATSQSS